MDSINFNGVHSISSCDVNTNFHDRCQVDWSATNLISFVSLDGIYILKPQLDVQNGPFQMDLIRNLNSKFNHHPVRDNFPCLDTFWQTFDNRKYMEVFLDPSLMTALSRANLDLYPRRFRLAKWSPVINNYPKQCLLAAITLDYELLIFHCRDGSWSILESLSHVFDGLHADMNLKSNPISEPTFEAIQSSIHALSFCHMCWKNTESQGPLLMAATIPGDIVLWLCKTRSNQAGDASYTHIQFEVGMILRTSLVHISSMNLFDNLLVVSARDGQVVLFDLTPNFNLLEEQRVQDNSSSAIRTLNLVTLPPTATLWHEDNIEVTDFYIQPISEDTFRVVLAKSTNICWCIINYTKMNGDKPAALAISDSFSAIDGLDPEISLHQTPAAWLKPAGDRRAVLIADDGSFFQLEFAGDRQDTTPEFHAIRTDGIDLSHMVPRGLCTSPGGHLIVMISCITVVYETAKVWAPTRIVLLPTENEMRFFSDNIGKLLDEKWLAQEQVSSPMDVCDRIDYIRSLFASLNSSQIYGLFTILHDNINKIEMPKNDIQLVKLKISSFLLMKLQAHSNSTMIDSDQLVNLDKKVYDIILLYNIEKTLASITSKNAVNSCIQNLNFAQVNSLRNYFEFISRSIEYSYLKDHYVEFFQLLESQKSDIPQEACSICQADIPFESPKYATCSNQHRFDRCGRSLLALSLKVGIELTCEHCKRHFTATLIWPTSRDLWLCCYCQ